MRSMLYPSAHLKDRKGRHVPRSTGGASDERF